LAHTAIIKAIGFAKALFKMNQREQNQKARFLNRRWPGKRTRSPGFKLLILKGAEGVTK
jgi:hypothetical protein